jgi:nucleotide-binding universal stress UspA family protein
VHALHLVNPTDRASFYVDSEHQRAQHPALIPLLQRAREIGADVRPLSFVSSDAAKDICQVAKADRTELILIGWHKPVLSQTFLGGIVYDVLRDAPSNVGVFVDRGLERVRRVLVPFMGSIHDRVAVELAHRVLGRGDTEATLLHVRNPSEPSRDSDEVTEEPGGGRVIVRVVHHASPIDAALAEMANGYDLVLIGASREWGLEQRLLGVQRERLVLESSTSLLIVRARPPSASAPSHPPPT